MIGKGSGLTEDALNLESRSLYFLDNGEREK